MKRILAIGMALLLLLSVAGCSKETEEAASKPSEEVQSGQQSGAENKEEEKQEQADQNETPQGGQSQQGSGSATDTITQIIGQQGSDSGGSGTNGSGSTDSNTSGSTNSGGSDANSSGKNETQKDPLQQIDPALQRNTKLEQALAGKWSTTLDYSTQLDVDPGVYVCTQYYTFENGKLTISFHEEQMRTVLKSVLREVYQQAADEANTTPEALGITEEVLDAAVNTNVTSAKEMAVSVDYMVYGEDLWYGGMKQGTIASIDSNRVVLKSAEDPAQTITLTR